MEKIFSFFRTHKKPFTLGVLAILALSIPIIVAQVLKQQDIRQRASAGAAVTLSLSPASASKNINDEFDVQLLINTNTNDISAIDGYLKYDDTKLQLMSKTAGTPYTEVDGTLTDYSPSTGGHAKVQEIILYNQTATPVTGSDKIAVTFHFKAIANGVAGMYFGTIDGSKTLKIAASGFAGNVPITNASGLPTATFTIGTAATATPTTTPIPTGRTFNYNGGKDHCAILNNACNTALNETEVAGSNCSTYMGQTARVCRTSGYPPVSDNLLSACSTLSPDGYVRYCIPNGGEIPTGWTPVASGDSVCTSFNNTTSKCYKSLFSATGRTVPDCTALSGKPDTCSCTINSQCASNNCIMPINPAGDANPSGICMASVSPTTVLIPAATTAPTATLVPTVTFAPGETVLQLLVQLPGIGTGAANLGLNATPHRPQRTGEVKILSGNTQVVKTATATMTYNPVCSCYKGNFALGASFPSGSYTAKVKFDNSLLKAFPGIINITSGQQVESAVPTTTLIPGDLNGDNTLGIIDWTLMIACIKNEAACTSGIRVLADLNDNDAVDELDVQILQRGFAIRNGD